MGSKKMRSTDDRPRPDAGARTEKKERSAGKRTRSRPTREGAAAFPDDPWQRVKLTLLGGELALLDRLAMDIRLVHGAWITRSGIVTALIEAAMRTEGEA